MTVMITPSGAPKSDDEVQAILHDPGFARYPTDHMVTATYENGEWGPLALRPYESLQMDPLAATLHYSQSVFEGLKAFKLADGTVSMFRPEMNAARFANSARRMAMPPLPDALFIEALEAIVRIDHRWIPTARGTSMYLRPLMFATESCLTVRPSLTYEFVLLALPAAPYFANNYQSITVSVVDKYVRAARGGTGEAKCGANYSASMLAKQQASVLGCSEALWLDANEHRFIEELGGMNVFFVERHGENATLLTPPLNGSILPGVTRNSLLTLAPQLGYDVQEREIPIDEVIRKAQSAELTEAFACGTAAVVAPIGELVLHDGTRVTFGDGNPGSITTSLFETLVDVQLGRSELFPEWRHGVSI